MNNKVVFGEAAFESVSVQMLGDDIWVSNAY